MWLAAFPGQGSQHIGMGKFLYDNFKEAQHLFEEASDTLSIDMKKLCFEGSESELALTYNTQPALLLVSSCYDQVLRTQFPITFKMTAGHSVGEYASLVQAKSLSFYDGLRAVRKRGQAMQEAVPVGQGGMAAVMGLTPDQITQLCRWAEEKSGFSPVEPANFNCPGQTVISGHKKALDWLQENISKDIFAEPPKRLKLIPLKVSAPFHCSLMKPAQEVMSQFFNDIEFQEAELPVIQNFTAQATTSKQQLKENIIQQISGPVRWTETIEGCLESAVTKCLELGAGKVISGLVKKIAGDKIQTYNINSIDELREFEKNV